MRVFLLTAVLSMASALAIAADTPGTPNQVTATSQGPTGIALAWAVTSRRDEYVKFEVEARENDAPVAVEQPDGTSGTGEGWLPKQGYTVSPLEPEQHYCFRVWSQYVDSGVRSAQPSAWACANTTAVPPLAPLDFTATYVPGASHALLHWNTPDQSAHRPIDYYEIERQSPPGPNRPALIEGKVQGPKGEQTATTKLSFMFQTSQIALPGNHAFRVCSVNSGGRVCAGPIAAVAENQKNESERRPATPSGTAAANTTVPGESTLTKNQSERRPATPSGAVAANTTVPGESTLTKNQSERRPATPSGTAAANTTVPGESTLSKNQSERRPATPSGTAAANTTVLRGSTLILGESTLTANGGQVVQAASSGQGVAVFQGAASDNYVLVSPINGSLINWSFRSGGAPHGSRFQLAVLAPATGTDDGQDYRLLALSPPQPVSSPTGVDGVEGPFQLKPELPIDPGYRLALIPVDGTGVPLEKGVNGKDGIRSFMEPFGSLGSSETINPASTTNTGFVLPLQARVDDGSGAIGADAAAGAGGGVRGTGGSLVNTAVPTIASSTKVPGSGTTLICNPGTWSWDGSGTISYEFGWLWDGAAPPPPVEMKGAVFGTSGGGQLQQQLGGSKLPSLGGFSSYANTASIVVPPLDGSTRFECVVTATAGSLVVSAQPARLFVPAGAPLLRGPGPAFPRQVPPSIPAVLAVGGKATCLPGVWTGTPQFAYAWYTLSGLGGRKAVGNAQVYTPAPGDEGQNVQCTVTARNVAGTATADSNVGTVSVAAAVATSETKIHFDARSPDSTGLVTGPGTTVIAELMALECRPADWNRSDLTSTFQWFRVDLFGNALSAPVAGAKLVIDMRPGDLQYNMLVACKETVTTGKGVTSTSVSPPLHVWNGCSETYTVAANKGFPDVFVRPEAYPWLDTWNPPVAQNYQGAGPINFTGLFGLGGRGLPKDQDTWRAVTLGPNCLDYQKRLEDSGYDVKQGPTEPADWIRDN